MLALTEVEIKRLQAQLLLKQATKLKQLRWLKRSSMLCLQAIRSSWGE